ncbi:hypothetical protein [Paenibacillus eucommiae]|uniref:DUF4064 domain-containing protein n=1 Tax=Paenibacillus eucommiae TaxID=1355755 RepID=A0ABS4INX2_9BACL|nr:hypothetical protein [Paenibacillus eucommiae]MBP1989210.1 hypothetical protein [Paenibacillus eucommiae]
MNWGLALAIFGGIAGLLITGIAIYTAWVIHQLWSQQAASPRAFSVTEIAARYLSRWTTLDYGVLGVSVIGVLFLMADLMAIMRDRTSGLVHSYHFAYLLCGIIFSVLGMLMLFARLLLVIGIAKAKGSSSQSPISPKQHNKPDDADHAE